MSTLWASDSIEHRSDRPGFAVFSGIPSVCKGRNAVRVPSRAQYFRKSKACWTAECAHFVRLWAPSGAFFNGGRCCGELPPCIPQWTGCCSLPAHGRSWLGHHDLRKSRCEFLCPLLRVHSVAPCSARGGRSATSWSVRGEGDLTCAQPVGDLWRRVPPACLILSDGEPTLPCDVALLSLAVHGCPRRRLHDAVDLYTDILKQGICCRFFAKGYTGIVSWLDGPTRYTAVHSRMVAVLLVDGDAAGGRPPDVGWEDRMLIRMR